jgi:hypothetical protein
MSDKHTVAYKPGEKTRWFAVGSGDIFLCKEHAEGRLNRGEQLGIPHGGAACLMGLRPFPTGKNLVKIVVALKEADSEKHQGSN